MSAKLKPINGLSRRLTQDGSIKLEDADKYSVHAMRQTNEFPRMVVQMVAVGAESGALDTMLDKSAIFYEEMIDNANDGLISRIELIIVAFLGIVAGDMMIAMNLSIFRMSGAMN